MPYFCCPYCNSNDDIGGVLNCGGCNRSYCHNCWYEAFIHNTRHNCIYCARQRVYINCSKCNKSIDIIDIKKKCHICHRQLCVDCQNSENHGHGVCW